MSSVSSARVNWNRFKSAFRTLLGNRLAATGLVILLGFTFLAVAGPYLTPYDPQASRVSAPYSPPTWAKLFLPGYEDRSENIQFTSLDVQAASAGLTGSELSEESATVSYARPVSGQNVTAFVKKTLDYPYKGAAGRFFGNAILDVEGVSPASPLEVRLFFKRLDTGREWLLWKQSVVNNSQNVRSPISLDSKVNQMVALLGYESLVDDPAGLIFARAGIFEYTLELKFTGTGPSTTEVTVRSFNMNLFGTAFGLLGTNHLGQDLFTQIAYGARVSLTVGLLASLIGVGIGLAVGIIAGFLGKIVDETLMRFTDMLLVIPALPLIIVLIAVLGPSFIYLILVIGFLSWQGFARVIRSQVLSLRERPFVEAAKAAGAGNGHIMGRHIFPNLVSLTYVALATSVPSAILTEAGLSFLGLFDPTVISWGRIINEALGGSGTSLASLWWWILPPGFSIALVSVSFVLLGYALDEIFNPRLRRRR